jgi:hypothetical protein
LKALNERRRIGERLKEESFLETETILFPRGKIDLLDELHPL